LFRGVVWLVAVVASNVAMADDNSDLAKCRQVGDSLVRLTCYDKIPISADKTNVPNSTTITSASSAVFMTNGDLSIQEKNYELNVFNPRVELRLRFKNTTKKPVVALGINILITDAFGDVVVNEGGKLDIKIPVGDEVDSPSFYFWDDNQFIAKDPYSLIVGAVEAGTAVANVKVLRAIYEDGSSEEFSSN
jgi:hypothetical protein